MRERLKAAIAAAWGKPDGPEWVIVRALEKALAPKCRCGEAADTIIDGVPLCRHCVYPQAKEVGG